MCNICVLGAGRDQKRPSSLLELELQVVVNHHVGASNKPRSSASVLNHSAISLVYYFLRSSYGHSDLELDAILTR